MATEATPGNLATSNTPSDNELNTTQTTSNDVSPTEQPLVNGKANTDKDETKQDVEPVEAALTSAEVSVSGGSDTEASKAETSKTQVDEKGHLRTASSVKKAISFKPVSVNKTFLAAKSATASTTLKLGDKGSPGVMSPQSGTSASSTPRPRLVAKAASGLRDSAPRTSSISNGGKPGAAPDPSAVWNKNRPAPPPEPKRFTDEELKQRYGIHLATRLQSDDPGREKNWADIDDDDDDWAPETIEWTDGTKITLPHPDETPAPTPEPAPVPLVQDTRPVEVPKSKSPAPIDKSGSPTVKPSGLGSGRAGLILKGATEKPTLVAKPPGPPTPVKSPWASLPPVDKVPPIAIDTPQNQPQQQSRFSQRDPHGFQGMPPPAKEIAADDFSRSWRDGSANTSRELYNSQSGRYEPVNDGRRGSTRNDPHSRQPAVLQRPAHDGPAEPSAAFQTHRAGGQDAAYVRRRTSSNVSGGSGHFARRMSRGHELAPQPHEMLNVRRGSLAAVSDAPSSPRGFSPSGQQPQRGYQNQTWQSRTSQSPVISHPSPQSVHGQIVPSISGSVDGQSQPSSAVLSEEQIFEDQKKRMQIARELAIKRRQEEEAKEEAAKRERIRIKLEAMGPPPEKPKKETPKQEKAVPTQIQVRESADTVPAQSKQVESTEVGKVKSSAPPATSAGEVKTSEKGAQDHRANDVQEGESAAPGRQGSQDARSSQSWQGNSAQGSDRYQAQGPWAPPAQQSASRSVWGPPTSDKTLGNGTFNPELSRIPNMHPSSLPGPIGPPNSNRGNDGQFARGRGRELYNSRPAPIGPPNRNVDQHTEEQRRLVSQSGWANAAESVQKQDTLIRQKQDLELAQRRELEEQGVAPDIAQPVYKETWRQVTLNEDGSRSKTETVHADVHDASSQFNSGWKSYPSKAEDVATRAIFDEQDPARRRHLDAIGNTAQSQFADPWRPATMNASPRVRDSRFFPNNRDIRHEDPVVPFERPGSPSPPPPTMAGHPAYDGDTAHPHVSLPRPAPVVKLPPVVLAPIGPPKPTSFAAAVIAPTAPSASHAPGYSGRQDYPSRNSASHQDSRRVPEPTAGVWQDRINTLIGRKHSPPKTHALAVDSSSKHALELPNSQFAATVSLPSLSSSESGSDDAPVASKPAAEECFEEQEMGSLPVIKLPSNAPPTAWAPAGSPPKFLPKKFLAADVTSVEPVEFTDYVMNNRINFLIRLPGEVEGRLVYGPFLRQKSNPRRGGARGGTPRQSSSSHPRGGRGRDASSGFQSPKPENSTVASGSNPTSRGGGRGGRGYGSNWNRHVSTPVQT
ncbi:Uncharacterized protein BP5553_04324 [Venustampulla echinocandica]|uniref:Uncharacterized protein n=1 Tax=Venustampulla echinocandica TaxID=2656787 RepID=A0A370TWS4_9HELO|nr:Uncharacterized protein BP5553_04324 [Venustampulla echinocandica]RDL39984.1 Uncharacterized protein BP5553_04324 [Venustampulla echinocandica]